MTLETPLVGKVGDKRLPELMAACFKIFERKNDEP
jgi:hypothetical protein